MTATFNYYLGDHFETITLAEGEVKVFTEGGPTEEGHNYTYYNFTHEGEVIRLEVCNSGRDCDGRLDSYRELVCPLDKLAGYATPDGVMTPDWEKADEYQRDYSAETMGY